MRPKTMRTNRIRKCIVAGAVATALTLSAACGLAPNTGPNTSPSTQTNARGPITTTDGDWKSVADALGRTGKLGDNNTAYRVTLTRTDLHVTSYGVAIKPGLSLGGYAAFARYDNNETC